MIEKLIELGIDLKGRTRGQHKTKCPQCSETRKHKSEPCLSVNIDEGTFTCHNCGWSGRVYEKQDKTYTLPTKNNTKLSDKTLAWFKDRGIGPGTITAWDITESKHFFPQVQEERQAINFNYFRDGELVNVKYRDGAKNFTMAKGAELVFYGLDKIKDNESAVITEGEIDALSFYEANVLSVCSVPNGASKAAQKLEYLDNCWKEFKDFKIIYIATDNDEPGVNLRNELARRLGKARCRWVDFGDVKDANEYLVKYGADALKSTLTKNVKTFPIEGIIRVNDFAERIDYIHKHGFPKGMTVGHDAFDRHLRYLGGQWTLVVGLPFSGKSEVVDQITMSLAYRYEAKTAMFSSENMPYEYHFTKLAEKYIGKRWEKFTSKELAQAKEFIHEYFFWININENDLSLDGILDKFGELVVTHGIKLVNLDPWNQIEHIIPSGMHETQYVSKALSRVINFVQQTDTHAFLVVHPTKPQRDNKGVAYKPKLSDAAGSMNFSNKAYNGFVVYRDFDNNTVEALVQKVKFKFCGIQGTVPLTWQGDFGGRYWQLTRDVAQQEPIDYSAPRKKDDDTPF